MQLSRSLIVWLWLVVAAAALAMPTALAQEDEYEEDAYDEEEDKDDEEEEEDEDIESDDEDNPCRLWLAPSYVSGDGDDGLKFGLFSGVALKKGDVIPQSELGIPMVDFVDSHNRKDTESENMVESIESYLWTAEQCGTRWEGNTSAPVAIPGIGVLAQYHSGISNVEWLQAAAMIREKIPGAAPPPGKPHPSRGAITDFYNYTLKATTDIPPGMELYANFGDVWDGNQTESVFQDKLDRWDYEAADRVLDRMLEFMNKYDEQMTPQQKDDVLEFLMHKVLGTAAGKHAKVIRSLIPEHPGKLQTVKDMGGTFAYRNYDIVRSKRWLEKHGICVDNITPGPSTIPEAGRGAFATRMIKKGQVIAPSPMMVIANKDILNMYDIKKNNYVKNKPRPPQLLINYSFGHPESSLLLFPIGGMVGYINHKPAKEGANAFLTWSKHPEMGNAHELHAQEVGELQQVHDLRIVMNVVAAKNINQGDEIFLDYGPAWQSAWDSYMAYWNSTYGNQDATWQKTAMDMREEYKDKPFETYQTEEQNPYPSNVHTSCFLDTEEMEDGHPKVNEWGLDRYRWIGPNSYDEYVGPVYYICDVIERFQVDGGYNYTVLAHISDTIKTEVERVPHWAISFIDKPYKGDVHKPDVFRHPIGIPDHYFPQQWRDLR